MCIVEWQRQKGEESIIFSTEIIKVQYLVVPAKSIPCGLSFLVAVTISTYGKLHVLVATGNSP